MSGESNAGEARLQNILPFIVDLRNLSALRHLSAENIVFLCDICN